MVGKFEIYQDKGQVRFPSQGGQRKIIAAREASKAAAKNGIASVQKNAADAKVVDLTE
jgi:uncharacterized protein YegP (UPF0339 family)